MSDKRQWAFPRGDGRKKGVRLEPKTFDGFTDTKRLDWLDHHRSAEHDNDSKEHWVVAWLNQDEPGNKGSSGRFVARAATFRDCVDMFLRGDAVRID